MVNLVPHENDRRQESLAGRKIWVDVGVEALKSFMALRCFAFKNQSQTIRGYSAAIKYFNKMLAG